MCPSYSWIFVSLLKIASSKSRCNVNSIGECKTKLYLKLYHCGVITSSSLVGVSRGNSESCLFKVSFHDFRLDVFFLCREVLDIIDEVEAG